MKLEMGLTICRKNRPPGKTEGLQIAFVGTESYQRLLN